MSDLVGFASPKMDWSAGPDLESRFKRFKQKCQLLFDGPLSSREEEQKSKYLLLWTGDYGLDLFNTWNLSSEDENSLDVYWRRFEEHVKPQSNHILNRYYLRGLKQNSRPLDDFLTEAKLLIQNSGFPSELHDELMRDTLVFGVDSEVVRKKCIAEGNELTFKKAKEIARTEEATKLQLKVMAGSNQVDAIKKGKSQDRGKGQFNYSKGSKAHRGARSKESRGGPNPKPNQCNRCGATPHGKGQRCPAANSECYGCHKIGHFRHMCFKLKNTRVHTLEEKDYYVPTQSDYQPVYDENFFLETLSVEQNSNPSNESSNVDNIKSRQNRNKIMSEIHFTAKPH